MYKICVKFCGIYSTYWLDCWI